MSQVRHLRKLLNRVFALGTKPEEPDVKEELEERVVLGGFALEFIRAPLYKELKSYLVDLAEQEHGKLMSTDKPITREEYKGFIQAITLVSLYIPNLVTKGREARERMEAKEII